MLAFMMRVRSLMVPAVVLSGFFVVPFPGADSRAMTLPRTVARYVTIVSMSCAAPGDCVAGGYYHDEHANIQAFVVSQTGGRWRKAIEVPGTAALNAGGNAMVNAVSCAPAGPCVAGGFATGRSHGEHAFLVGERNGRWGKAIRIRGPGATAGQALDVNSVSCWSAGNCAAGGSYRARVIGGPIRGEAFVVSQKNGHWGTAVAVPGLARFYQQGVSTVNAISCAPPGGCGAGGFFSTRSGSQAFVVSEKNGRWARAIEVPGSGTLNAEGAAEIGTLSCSRPGDCGAGGPYLDGSGRFQAFVARENNGHWAKAIEVPGSGARNVGGNALVVSVSCPAPGNCAAVGLYSYAKTVGFLVNAFVVSERSGHWGNAILVPGLAKLDLGKNAFASSVSCAARGDCAAVGGYTDRSGRGQGFVVSERNGHWGDATQIPGVAKLNRGEGSSLGPVSCTSPGNCAAGGSLAAPGGPAFVARERNGRWGMVRILAF